MWPEWVEFLFHLIISCVLGIVFTHLIKKWSLSNQGIWILSFGLTLPTVLLYFPLSYLSIKDVPELFDIRSIFMWTVGHIIYASSLPSILFIFRKKAVVL